MLFWAYKGFVLPKMMVKLSFSLISFLFQEIIEGLVHIHTQGMIHR
jgi:serine/threonine protein kinase